VLALALVAAGAALAVTVVLLARSPARSTGGSAVSRLGAAIVQRRDLVETDTEGGTLSYANPQTVYNWLSGTITWLPAIGRMIKPGQTLFTIGGRPVVLLDGALPAYRALKPSDSNGLDILQLNRSLVRMGFGDGEITVNDTWQAGTTDAVKRWQAALGETQTGEIPLGEVVFLPGAQRVTQLDTTCGSAGGAASGAASSSTESTNGCGALQTTVAGSSTTDTASPTPILQTSSTKLVAIVDLPASSQSEAARGSRVTVELPSGSTVYGTITAVSGVAQSSSGGLSASSSGSGSGSQNTSATVPITITLERRVRGAGLDQAPVSVNFAEAKAKHVLSVPVTALVATSGASYAVQEAAVPQKLIPVSTGLFAAGYVQISGAGIHPGLKVTDSQG
jgi:hypothetical protein